MHWEVVNKVAHLVGWAFLLFGAVASLSALIDILNPRSTVLVQGVPTTDIGIKGMILAFMVIITILGILLVGAKSFYPKHIKTWLQEQKHTDEGTQQ